MNILSLCFILFMGIVPVLANFKAKKPIYTFRRNYIPSRPIQTILLIWLIWHLIISMILHYYADIVIILFAMLILAIFSAYDYLKKGEGHYEDGLILWGLFYPKESIEGYDFSEYDSDRIMMVIRFKNTNRRRRIILPNEIAKELKESIDGD